MLILFLIYSILCSEALLQRCLFFFLQPVAGLTNRVPVWDSRAGAPLNRTFCRSRCLHYSLHNLKVLVPRVCYLNPETSGYYWKPENFLHKMLMTGERALGVRRTRVLGKVPEYRQKNVISPVLRI